GADLSTAHGADTTDTHRGGHP
ncbi:MAG: hypothetical protein QOE59_4410, partial [Actinomycetota bacterium]|nr:hypothetical protein [Actinomycetota bacterium]